MILSILAIFILFIRLFLYNDKRNISSEQISAMLSKESELTTAKLRGKGYTNYKDEGVPILSQGNFIMTYEYVVRAGVDVEKVESKIDKNNKIVWLSIPKAEIFDVKVEPSTICYYDESFALFNVDEREDANAAQVKAEEDAMKTAKDTGILELANQQAEMLIKGIIVESLPDEYKVRIRK